jgi:hypothetical protein
MEKEKQAQMTLRAAENEKDDIIRSYKDSCSEIKRLSDNVDKKDQENGSLISEI